MIEYVLVKPKKDNRRAICFDVEGGNLDVNEKYDIAEGMLLTNERIIIIFYSENNRTIDFLGRALDFNGLELYKIAFPSCFHGRPDISFEYMWSTGIDNGVKIYFGTNTVSVRDFWYDFDLIDRKYIASGDAR